MTYGYELSKQTEKRDFGELFFPVSERVQMNFIFSDNMRMLCLSCNIKKGQKGTPKTRYQPVATARIYIHLIFSDNFLFILQCQKPQTTAKLYKKSKNKHRYRWCPL